MAVFVFDSSALVKRYRQEQGTDWVRARTTPEAENELYVALIAGAEVVSALMRQQRRGELSVEASEAARSAFRHHYYHQYHVVAITEAVIEDAMELAERHPLRGYDAVQLAAATQIRRMRTAVGLSTPVFVSADITLNGCAEEEGFAVEDPNEHDS